LTEIPEWQTKKQNQLIIIPAIVSTGRIILRNGQASRFPEVKNQPIEPQRMWALSPASFLCSAECELRNKPDLSADPNKSKLPVEKKQQNVTL
jgi:hypothetical protein